MVSSVLQYSTSMKPCSCLPSHNHRVLKISQVSFPPPRIFDCLQAVLDALTELNGVYREKFGFVFLVCASGKPADEILALLKARLPNDRDTEVLL